MDEEITDKRSLAEKDRSGFAIFRGLDAPLLDETGMMKAKLSPDAIAGSTQLMEGGVQDGSVVRRLFSHAGEDGFSLVHVWFKANYHLARHSHDADCLYYVLSGEVIMGSQVLRAGDGFYIPLDQSYGYRAGSGGVEVLEFRHATSFDIKIDEKPEVFARILQTVKVNHDQWASETVPPSRR